MITDLHFAGDWLVFVRGGAPNRRGELPNPLGLVAGEGSAPLGDGPLETAIRQARTVALDVLRRHATDLGARAVVGLRTSLAVRKTAVAVTVLGTAVELS